ncbi:MAG: four-helix bundle copper-binding protein [Candidatus Diapherotrites archaeon]|nr:four-helix bundle copper-binding protein [Candidatus Diapherotrites archaeon]
MEEGKEMSQEMKDCIDKCMKCARTCDETIVHCLEMGGAHAEKKHVLLLVDCARVCKTAAKLLMHDSEFHPLQCGVCERICRACADECMRFEESFMRDCARICGECADSCKKMSG